MHWRLNGTHACRVAPGVRDQQVGASASHPETMMACPITATPARGWLVMFGGVLVEHFIYLEQWMGERVLL